MVQLTFLPKMSAIYCWKALFTNYFAIGVVLSRNVIILCKYVSLIVILNVLHINCSAIVVQMTIDHSVSD